MKTDLLKDGSAIPKTTIVQIVGYYPPHIGGMESVVKEISLGLAQSDWPVEVITSNVGAKHIPPVEHKGKYTLRRLSTFEFAHTPFMPALLWRLLRVKKPAIFHLHLSQVFVPEIVWLVGKLRRIPYVVHFHLDVDPSGPLGFLLYPYKRLIQPGIMRGAAHVIALSPEQGVELTKRYNLNSKKVSYAPNGVSQKFLEAGNNTRRLHKPLRLLFVGRFTSQKRADRLIDALSIVKTKVHLTLAGDGEDRAMLEKLVKDRGLSNVLFTGPLHRRKLLNTYKKADVLVMPSEKEGMSLVLLEAMATGLPVIGSDVEGIREQLKDVGILVPNPSPTTFAEAIDNFYEHRETQFSKLSAASRDKASQYSWPKLADQLKLLYQSLGNTQSPLRITRLSLVGGVIVWWLIFLGMRSVHWLPGLITNSVGFSFLALVPGLLTVACLRLKRLIAAGKYVLAIGFSILELLVVGLIGNTILQWFGIKRPLDTRYLLIEISALLLVLLVIVWRRSKGLELNVRAKMKEIFPTHLDRLVSIFPIIFVILSILGATSINNGGSDVWTLTMLIGLAVFGVVIVVKAKKLNDNSIVSALFLMSLSLLFMTSLRGWYTTGHDIQIEYQVFQLAKTNGVWQIQRFRDPYNACLSITILPTMLANILKIFDPYVYKVFFQILFASCPATIYLLARRWTSSALAFLATFYFLAFPTFFTDLPFLNRQEIAFIFFALMLYVIFQSQLSIRLRRILFLVFGVGLVLSHYSTTYSVIAILLLSAGIWPLIVKCCKWLNRRHLFANSSLKAIQTNTKELKRITLTMVVILTSASLLWTIVLTNTGSSVLQVVKQTTEAVRNGFKEDVAKSNDTNYNLFSWATESPVKELNDYVQTEVKPQRANNPGVYYPASSYQSYPINVATDETQPLTRLGKDVSKTGLNVVSFNVAFRQTSAKLLQILVILGFIYLLFRRKFTSLLPTDFIALSIGCVIFVALQVILPVLSVDYGLLRTFQQSLVLLGLFIVLGSLVLFSWLPSKKLRIAATALLALLFFVSTTGVIPQILGGYDAQLNLNNSGTYYDAYYTHSQEIAGINWLNGIVDQLPSNRFKQIDFQADQYTYNRLSTYTQLGLAGTIYPGLVRKDSYVFLGYSNVNKNQSIISYNGDLVSYNYPTQFLNQQKNLIYSNGGTDIYR